MSSVKEAYNDFMNTDLRQVERDVEAIRKQIARQ